MHSTKITSIRSIMTTFKNRMNSFIKRESFLINFDCNGITFDAKIDILINGTSTAKEFLNKPASIQIKFIALEQENSLLYPNSSLSDIITEQQTIFLKMEKKLRKLFFKRLALLKSHIYSDMNSLKSFKPIKNISIDDIYIEDNLFFKNEFYFQNIIDSINKTFNNYNSLLQDLKNTFEKSNYLINNIYRININNNRQKKNLLTASFSFQHCSILFNVDFNLTKFEDENNYDLKEIVKINFIHNKYKDELSLLDGQSSLFSDFYLKIKKNNFNNNIFYFEKLNQSDNKLFHINHKDSIDYLCSSDIYRVSSRYSSIEHYFQKEKGIIL